MSLRNFSLLAIFLFTIAPNHYTQLYQRLINYPIVTNGITGYQNVMSGGFNNIEHQFIDIDNDGDYDLFFLNSDGTFGLLKNEGNPGTPEFILSLDTIPGLNFLDWYYFFDADFDSDFDFFTSNGEYITYKKKYWIGIYTFFRNYF